MAGEPMAIGGAVTWIADLLTGTLATSVAVIAVAGVGFATLQGRISARDCARVVLGCFIVFSARQIAEGLASLVGASPPPDFAVAAAPPASAPAKPAGGYDPYAGASVPGGQ